MAKSTKKLTKKLAIEIVAKRLEEFIQNGLEKRDLNDSGVKWIEALEMRASWILNDINFDELLNSFNEKNKIKTKK